jgi:WD40 repeat protein
LNKQRSGISYLKTLINGNLASASYDFSLIIWDVKNNYNILHIVNFDSEIEDIVSLFNGDIATIIDSYSIRVWSIKDNYTKSVEIANDSFYCLLVLSNGNLACGTSNGVKAIKVYDIYNYVLIHEMAVEEGPINSMGLILGGNIIYVSHHTNISIWDKDNYILLITLNCKMMLSLIVMSDDCFAISSSCGFQIFGF